MVKRMIAPVLICLSLLSHGQLNKTSSNARLLKANLSFTQSFMLNNSNKNVYLSGNLEYYTSAKFSLRGDCFWYLDSRQSNPIFKQNAIVLFGPVFHLPKGKSDFYAGIQPGLSYTKPTDNLSLDYSYPSRLLPAFSILAGYTFYFSKFCNFFIGANYLASRYRGAEGGSINLDEFMISGGLGFHLRTSKSSENKSKN
jgi:hypothetical protein